MCKLSILLAAAILISLSTGSSLAWLWDKEEKANAFTVGAIRLRLEETTGEKYQMLPGCNISKDPTVTVLGGSEACWLFLQITQANDPTAFLQYSLAPGWLPLPGESEVWYRPVEGSEEDQVFPVLTGNTLSVPDTVIRSDLDIGDKHPKLIFRARAIQQMGPEGVPFTPEEGWSAIREALDATRESGAL